MHHHQDTIVEGMSNVQMNIREYTPADKQDVLNLLRLNTPQYFAAEEEPELIHYLDHEIEYYYVIELNSSIAGCGGINFPDKNKGRISWDIIHPNYQGMALGTALLRYRIDRLKAMNNIKAITVRTSQLVYPFYEKNGFELIEVVKDYWAKGFDLYHMEYQL